MAAIALGLSAASSYFGGLEADRRAKQARRAQEAARNRQIGAFNLYGDLGLSQLEAGLSTLGTGYDRARAEAGALGAAARQRANDQAKVLRGRAEQNLLSTGFDRSNIASQVDRSLAADTARRHQEIDSGLAQLYSQIAVNRARSESDMRRSMAAMLERRGQGLASIEGGFGSRMFDLDTTSFQAPQFDFSGLAELLGGE